MSTYGASYGVEVVEPFARTAQRTYIPSMRPFILLTFCALIGACTRTSEAAPSDSMSALRTALRDQRDAGLALDSALLRAIAITDARARAGLPAAAPSDSEYWRNWRDVTQRQRAFDSVSARSAALLAH